jgi:hypothetical protein
MILAIVDRLTRRETKITMIKYDYGNLRVALKVGFAPIPAIRSTATDPTEGDSRPARSVTPHEPSIGANTEN